jgi:hypothetical protein
MKILYIARHSSGDNDDEGAIAHSLESLGHKVILALESTSPLIMYRKLAEEEYRNVDFVLFNHCSNYSLLSSIKAPKVFWCFDLIDFSSDPSLECRNKQRIEWINKLTSLTDLGFLSDGDWVNRDRTGKLHRLMQGADTRVASQMIQTGDRDILFTGEIYGGEDRKSWARFMRSEFGLRFQVYPPRRGTKRKHGKKLCKLLNSARIIAAPDGPVTDHYWSNRVYLTLGFGAFLIHPYCKTLEEHYVDKKEIVFYRDRTELKDLINYYLKYPEQRRVIRQAGYARTMADHTYTNRCRELINIVKKHLL